MDKNLNRMCVLLLKIACATAGEVRKWMEAFDHAKQQVLKSHLEIVFHVWMGNKGNKNR